MPNIILNLQLFADEGAMADTGNLANSTAENPVSDGVATEATGEQIATAPQDEETFGSLIKGKYKSEFDAAVKSAIDKRFKNQRDLQSQIDSIDPMIRALAQRYQVQADANGSIPIDALSQKIFADDSMYEQEAFDRGMSVETLKEMKALEMENARLRMNTQRSAEQQEWEALQAQGDAMREVYPDFDLDIEMQNPQFGRLLATMQRSGFPDPVRTAYEAVHREELTAKAMQYAVGQATQKISNSIQSGLNRPVENGMSRQAPGAPTGIDPSKLSKEQIQDYAKRAARGERITFN